ncbi:MAG: GNAT family N-acetyltransferase [Candidatus Odinarchaeota archaeon]
MVYCINSEHGEIVIRDARTSDAKCFVKLVNDVIDREGLDSFYPYLNKEQLLKKFDKADSNLLSTYTVADFLKNGSKPVTGGYTRLLSFPPGQKSIYFLRGPWVNSSLDPAIVKTLVEKTLIKAFNMGIKVVKAQVPLIFESRLKLLKEDFNFKMINRLFTYTLRVTEKSSTDVPDLPVTPVTIRLFSGDETDAERVAMLHNACFSGHYKISTETLSFLSKDNHIFIAENRSKGKTIAGMAWLEIRRISGEVVGTVSDLVVYPRFRNKGIATTLVLNCVRNAVVERVSRVNAEIADNNKQSIKTFSGCGFIRDEKSGVELLEKSLVSESL